MVKGWDDKYICNKKADITRRLLTTNNKKEFDYLNEQMELCSYISMDKIFSQGIVIEEEITMESFIREMLGETFTYPINSEISEIINQYMKYYKKLPKLAINSNQERMSPQEGITIIHDFIKDCFDQKHLKTFENIFINNNFVLYGPKKSTGYSISIDGDVFVKIPKSEDILMLSAMAHEEGHAYRIINGLTPRLDSDYSEYESFFYEFNFLNWLIKNNIYKQDALNQFLGQFNLLERILYMRYMIKKLNLDCISDPLEFKETMKIPELKSDLNISEDSDFFNMYYTTINTDLQKYLKSFVAVVNNLDDFDKYERIIKTLNNDNEEEIIKKELNNHKGEIKSYLKLRKSLNNSNL